ncbi:MAG: GNAT family N-acetyltransferase [Acidobacteriota bacterium]|nr:GNAT family N-acetyltransferase [Acidobacteriota bacterium]
MTTLTIKMATASEEAGVIGVLTLAFSSDPMARWAQPDPQNYLTNFPTLAKAFGGNAFAQRTAYFADGYGGAALWLPPGFSPDEETMIGLVERTAPDAIKGEIFGVFQEMGKYHPTEPHWYLPLIGVDPSQQGNGIGSALMKHALIPCDRDGTIAYLESSNPKNISLYKRHGFEVIGKIQVGSSPTMCPMLRKPR